MSSPAMARMPKSSSPTPVLPLPRTVRTKSQFVTLAARLGSRPARSPENASPAQIDAALRAAAVGLTVRDPMLAFTGFARLDDPEAPLLTRRELDVLGALGEGLSNKAVARRLGISQHTVKFHLESLFRKLGVTSRTEAVRKGLRQRLIEL